MRNVFPSGTVYIEEATICDIISYIINKHEGVQFIGSLKERMKKVVARRGTNGIHLIKENDDIQIDIYVVLHEMDSLFSRCASLQEEIKAEIEWMTGFRVKAVNIHVEKIFLSFS